jgi:hypothetical protein
LLNERVLVKNQTTASENGIYYVSDTGDDTGIWTITRVTDFDSSADITSGCIVGIVEGSINGTSLWMLTAIGTIVLDSTGLTFVRMAG